MTFQKIHRIKAWTSGIIPVIYQQYFNFSFIKNNFSKYLNESELRSLLIKYPHLNLISDSEIENYIKTFNDIGLPEEGLWNEPSLFSIWPITIRYRYMVLKECGINNVSSKDIASFLKIVRTRSIASLQESGVISKAVKLESLLTSHLTRKPISQTISINGDISQYTLFALRIKIIQRYLELMLEISEEEFTKGLKIHPNIKYRPLQSISETLELLERDIAMPKAKIKSNFYLIYAHPDNLKKLISNIESIAGVKMKEIIRAYPRFAITNYKNIIEIQKILTEYGVDSAAQIRNCFQIFQLTPAKVRDGLEAAKQIPELKVLNKHTRFLDIILYRRKVHDRIMKLSENTKRYVTIEVLCGNSAKFTAFQKACCNHYRTGELSISYISQALGKHYSKANIQKILKRHPYWLNIPLLQIKNIYDELSVRFSVNAIYENCSILLYPWDKVHQVIESLSENSGQHSYRASNGYIIDFNSLSESQKLNLILYSLEKKYCFTGAGVRTEERTVL